MDGVVGGVAVYLSWGRTVREYDIEGGPKEYVQDSRIHWLARC
jgi:hypothetical protein